MIFVASIVTGPLTLVLIAQFVSGLEEKAAILKVRIAGEEHAPELVNFLQRNDVEIEAAPADYEARVREGRTGRGDRGARGLRRAAASPATPRHVEIVYDDSRAESRPGDPPGRAAAARVQPRDRNAAHDRARGEPGPRASR